MRGGSSQGGQIIMPGGRPQLPEVLWVCLACGRHNVDRYKVGDESCFLNAALCYTDGMGFKDGLVSYVARFVEQDTPAAEVQR